VVSPQSSHRCYPRERSPRLGRWTQLPPRSAIARPHPSPLAIDSAIWRVIPAHAHGTFASSCHPRLT
jgi:hypothetical protein